ncbi:MAG TPA: YdcF family protein [Chloroflexota bacterium]|nr:YdcF family protein [Chloroflexota bacterium]
MSEVADALPSVTARSGRRWTWRLGFGLGLAVAVLALWSARGAVLGAVGGFLVVEDPLQPAAAIIVLDGGVPLREQEAARLYREGWAPRVVITRGPESAVRRLEALLRLGVPATAIEVVDERPSGTLGELGLLASRIGDVDGPVVLVTSPYHTRRAGLTWWRATNGRVAGIARPAWQEGFDLQSWWREPRLRLQVLHEYVGLVASLAGFRGD